MATYQDRKGKVFKTRAEASASNKAMGISKGSIDVSSPMSSDDLKADERPFDIPDVPEPTATTGLEGAIQSNTDSFVADLEARRKASEEQSDQTFADYVESKLGTKGETELTADAYSKGRVNPLTGKRESVDDIQYELDDINQQILVEQNALRRTVENIEKKGGGLAMGANTEVLNATRESLRKQADLSIIQLGIQGRFNSAKAIADRAVDLQLEQDKIKNETLKEIADRNWDEFTEDEKREFDTKQKDRERKLDEKKVDLDRKYALVLDAQQNGAPQSVIQAMLDSENASSAMKAAGNYIGLLDRQQKLASIASMNTNRLLALAEAGDKSAIDELGFDPSKIKEEVDPTTKRQLETKLEAGKNLVDLAEQYKGLVEKYGFENVIVGNQNIVGQYRSLRAQMVAAYKDAKQLGTLDKGVLELMSGIIGEEPTSGLYFTQNFFGGKQNRIINQIDELIESAGKENMQYSLRLGIDPVAFTMFSPEEIEELNAYAGFDVADSTSSGTGFDPESYYK